MPWRMCCNKWLFFPCCTGAAAEECHAFGDSTVARVDIQFREYEDQKCHSILVESADIEDGNVTIKDVVNSEINDNGRQDITENNDIDNVSKVSTSNCSDKSSVKKESNDRQNIQESEDIDDVSKVSSSTCSSPRRSSVKRESNDRQNIPGSEDIDEVSKVSSSTYLDKSSVKRESNERQNIPDSENIDEVSKVPTTTCLEKSSVKKKANDRQNIPDIENIDEVAKVPTGTSTCSNKSSVKNESNDRQNIPENDDIANVSKRSSSTYSSTRRSSLSDSSISSLNEDSPIDVQRLSKASTLPMAMSASLDVGQRERASRIPVVSVHAASADSSPGEHSSRKYMPQYNTYTGSLPRTTKCKIPVSVQVNNDGSERRQATVSENKSSIPSLIGLRRVHVSIGSKTSSSVTGQSIANQSKSSISGPNLSKQA